MTREEIFKQIQSRYCPLTKELKHEWTERSKLLQLKKGYVLANEGERSTKLWFVASGTIRAYYHKEGKKICDWFAFENDFICAISSFYSDIPSKHHIDLLSDSIVMETTREDIGILCEKYHEFERLGRLSATESMMRLQEKIVSIQFETAQKRLEQLLLKHPDIYQKIPLGDIASFIGITAETLSRLRANRSRT